MSAETVYRINSPAVIGEVLDGEAIIVNLDSGAYYSLVGAGADVWTAAQSGATLAGLVDLTVARYSGAPAEIAAGVAVLVEELVAEGLLVADEVDAGRAVAPRATGSPDGDRPPFVKPTLEKYTDMADLLLLDPIHEVDEQGWPHPLARAAEPKRAAPRR
jgi:hypothetical protein